MTWQGVCAIHKDICALCGEDVKGGSDNGTLDVPREGQAVVCLLCRLLGRDRNGEVQAPTPSAAFEAQAEGRRAGA